MDSWFLSPNIPALIADIEYSLIIPGGDLTYIFWGQGRDVYWN